MENKAKLVCVHARPVFGKKGLGELYDTGRCVVRRKNDNNRRAQPSPYYSSVVHDPASRHTRFPFRDRGNLRDGSSDDFAFSPTKNARTNGPAKCLVPFHSLQHNTVTVKRHLPARNKKFNYYVTRSRACTGKNLSLIIITTTT